MSRYICERLSFAQLYGYTDQGRRDRARSVRGPALELESSRGNMTYNFNFRAYPSTEGKRHQGYVRFFKPSNPNTPLDRLACTIDCDCLDFRYRWAWANKQRGSSQVGPMSLNKAHNRAPRITNPSAKPGTCKHIARVRDYIANQMYGGQGKTIDKLDRLVTLTRKPVVLGGKPVAQSKTPSTNLPPAKPANPWTTASNPNNESVVNVMHTRNLPNLTKLFEDDEKVSDSGLVYAGEDPNAAGGDKLDKLMALVKQVSDNVEKLVGTGAGGTTAEDELDEVPVEGAIELDLTTGEPKPGEDDDKLKLGPTKDQEAERCPPCNREDPEVPVAPEPEFEPEPELDDAGEDGEARAELDDAEALDDAALDDEAAALDLDKLAAGEGTGEDDEDEDEDEAPRRRGRNPDSA